MTFPARGRPADDWPGIPGANWGMGSRVIARGWTIIVYGTVVGATPGGPESWTINVRPHESEAIGGDGRRRQHRHSLPMSFEPSEIELDTEAR